MSDYLQRLIEDAQTQRKHMSPYEFAEYLKRAYTLGWEDRNTYLTSHTKPVRAFDGYKSLKFKSVIEASRKVMRNESNIRKAIKYSRKCAGYYWEYI